MGRASEARSWPERLVPALPADTPSLLVSRARLTALEGDHAQAFVLADAARARYAASGNRKGVLACLDLCVNDLHVAPTPDVMRSARAARGSTDPAIRAWGRLWLLKLKMESGKGASPRAVTAAVTAAPLDPRAQRARIPGDHLRYLGGSVRDIRCSATQMVDALSDQHFDYWPALVYAGRWDELSSLLNDARAVRVPEWARDFVEVWLRLPRAVLLALG